MVSIALPAAIDTAAATDLATGIAAAFSGTAKIILAAGNVERIGIAGLQVLASAARTADATGRSLTIKAPSDALCAAAAIAGLAPVLHLNR